MNSVLQLLWSLPPLAQRYVAPAAGIFKSAPAEPAADFATHVRTLQFFLLPTSSMTRSAFRGHPFMRRPESFMPDQHTLGNMLRPGVHVTDGQGRRGTG